MSEQSFSYWLQGFFELAKPESITSEQVTIIKNHINLVKKCWEPRKPQTSADGPDGGEHSFDLPPLEDLSIPALEDDNNLLPSYEPSGDIVLRC